MATVRADVEILLKFQQVDQSTTVRALEPEAFRHVFTSIKAAQARFTENAHGFGKLLSVTGYRGGNPVAAKLVGRMHDDNPLLKRKSCAALLIFKIAISPRKTEAFARRK